METEERNEILTADNVINYLVHMLGENLAVLSFESWTKIVEKLKEIEEKNKVDIISELEAMEIPVIPLNLVKKEEKKIITPESRIVTP